jgi:hypothetical protein
LVGLFGCHEADSRTFLVRWQLPLSFCLPILSLSTRRISVPRKQSNEVASDYSENKCLRGHTLIFQAKLLASILLDTSLRGKNMRFNFVSILVCLIAAGSAVAQATETVDGYKDIKFGISYAQLKALKKCSLRKLPAEDPLVAYGCENFNFNGKQTGAFFYFIKGKLLRVAIVAGNSSLDAMNYATALRNKYGAPTSLDPTQLANYDSGLINEADIAWQDGRVLISLTKSDTRSDILMLIYSDPEYFSKYTASAAKNVEKDL